MAHPALTSGRTAVITGAASGIGLAASKKLAALGMNVCMTDVTEVALEGAAHEVREAASGPDAVFAETVDVSDLDAMQNFAAAVRDRFGDVALLMNNAVTRLDAGTWENPDAWQRTFAVNLMGVVNGVHAFAADMLSQSAPSLIVNVGSKQGITNPPGSKPAYNAAKAAVINYTESLQHELRNAEGSQVSAHLLIPGWTTTGTNAHQQGAWLPGQVADYMLDAVARGDFYIVCPDDEVSPAEDRRRILWAAGDIADNRPPLSRWHADYGDAFADFKAD